MLRLKVILAFAIFFSTGNLWAENAKPETPSSSTIVVHKPAIDPSWGKVVQYQQEQNVLASDHSKETLYKFLFQDSQGIVRTAIYHEYSAGSGYWEVWIWDQP